MNAAAVIARRKVAEAELQIKLFEETLKTVQQPDRAHYANMLTESKVVRDLLKAGARVLGYAEPPQAGDVMASPVPVPAFTLPPPPISVFESTTMSTSMFSPPPAASATKVSQPRTKAEPKVDPATMVSLLARKPCQPSQLKIAFKSERGDYALASITRDNPLVLCRPKVKEKKKDEIAALNATAFTPSDAEHSSLLASTSLHAYFVYKEAGSAAGVDHDGYYLHVPHYLRKPPDGRGEKVMSAPTNPTWYLGPGWSDWKKIESNVYIPLQHRDRFCIGGQFHFRVRRPQAGDAPKPLDMEPVSEVGDAPSDSEGEGSASFSVAASTY